MRSQGVQGEQSWRGPEGLWEIGVPGVAAQRRAGTALGCGRDPCSWGRRGPVSRRLREMLRDSGYGVLGGWLRVLVELSRSTWVVDKRNMVPYCPLTQQLPVQMGRREHCLTRRKGSRWRSACRFLLPAVFLGSGVSGGRLVSPDPASSSPLSLTPLEKQPKQGLSTPPGWLGVLDGSWSGYTQSTYSYIVRTHTAGPYHSLHHGLAVLPLASYLASLCLSVFTYKMGL